MASRLNWGIIGTGGIAAVFARAVSQSSKGAISAVGSRSLAGAQRFAATHGISAVHGDYQSLVSDHRVQAVYIATPHPMHEHWIRSAAEAGKHVLCEKPLCMDHKEAERAVRSCWEHGVLLMEAFVYRCHPQTRKVVELIRTGAIGQVRLVQATQSASAPFHPENRIWKRELGGGAILDAGCYAVSYCRLVAGAGSGQPFLNPTEVSGAGHIRTETGVDSYAAAILKFENGTVAQAACGVGLIQDNSVRIYGSEGWIHIPVPFHPSKHGGVSRISVHRGGSREEIEIASPEWIFAMAADSFADAVSAKAPDVPSITCADSLGNMQALDSWRQAIGLIYPHEQLAAQEEGSGGAPEEVRAGKSVRGSLVP